MWEVINFLLRSIYTTKKNNLLLLSLKLMKTWPFKKKRIVLNIQIALVGFLLTLVFRFSLVLHVSSQKFFFPLHQLEVESWKLFRCLSMWLTTLKGGKNWDSPVSWLFCRETNQGLCAHLLIIFRSPQDGPDRPWGHIWVFFVPVEFQSGLEHKGPPALGISQGMHHLGISDEGNQIIIIPRIFFNVLCPLT